MIAFLLAVDDALLPAVSCHELATALPARKPSLSITCDLGNKKPAAHQDYGLRWHTGRKNLLPEAANSSYIMPSMPPIPPMPPGMAGASSFGASATMHSVVSIRPATEAAFCNAVRVTLVGSRIPISIMSP